eukprot:CAMPEP_0177635360 /NCGR_PEP_ID=MMETSP0447-20121125/3861_1 /TAXON_ID=0 /ORGANISM="Stygamoeba regulata, Strain BSH-02190019" /LENGTH=617 /DNA_ID=CAMNT_0019137145 /DNA_START=18 /DNA_END=1868 /DNA_ORIENTATION=+
MFKKQAKSVVSENTVVLEDAKTVKEAKAHLTTVLKLVGTQVKTARTQQTELLKVSDALAALSSFSNERLSPGNPLTQCASDIGNFFRLLGILNETLCSFWVDGFVEELDEFSNNELAAALLATKRYKSALSAFRAQAAVVEDMKKKKKVNPREMQKAESDLNTLKRAYESTEMGCQTQLGDARAKLDFTITDRLINLLDAYHAFVAKSAQRLESLQEKAANWKKESTRLAEDFQEVVAKRPKVENTTLKESIQNKDVVFGESLATIFSRESSFHVGLPSFMNPIFDYLTEKAPFMEGAFRVAPNKSSLKLFKIHIDQGNIPDFSTLDDPHVVTGLLQSWLRELPEPLCTFALYERFTALGAIDNQKSYIHILKNIIKSLPQANKVVLQRLMLLLQQVGNNSDVTKMTASNLAIVFGPTLLYSRTPDPYTFEAANKVIESMITNYDEIFREGQPVPAPSQKSLTQSNSPVMPISADDLEASNFSNSTGQLPGMGAVPLPGMDGSMDRLSNKPSPRRPQARSLMLLGRIPTSQGLVSPTLLGQRRKANMGALPPPPTLPPAPSPPSGSTDDVSGQVQRAGMEDGGCGGGGVQRTNLSPMRGPALPARARPKLLGDTAGG